ncbi:putative ribonuclease H-like domain-containing protein [Tanacetum coccineum]
MTHPHPKGNFVPKAVLMKSGIKTLNTVGQNFSKVAVSVNTARPINTAYPRPTVNSARTTSNTFNRAHSHIRRPFNTSTTNKNSNLNEKVNTVKGNVTTAGPKAIVSDKKGNEANAVKASACWVWRSKKKVLDHGNPQLELQEKGVINSGCSRHMTGNKSYLSYYEEIDGGFVAFGGDPKGGRITGKGKISTDTECVVLSHDFKLLDENHETSLDLSYYDEIDVDCCLGGDPKGGNKSYLSYYEEIDGGFVAFGGDPKGGRITGKGKISTGKIGFKDGRKPALSFMRPFGCPVTILNTIDHLGMFDGKADEGFFIGYSTIRKHSQGYSTSKLDGGKAREETVSGKYYILLPFLTQDSPFFSSSKDSPDAGFKPSREEEKKDDKDLENEDKNNDVDENIVYRCDDDPNMLNLEQIVYSDDDEGVDAKANMTNLDTHILVSPTPTTKIHKDHPLEQIIRDIHSAPQTRRITKNVTEHVVPKKVIQALQDPSWIERLWQESDLQFKLQQILTLIDLPQGKILLCTNGSTGTRKMKEALIEAIRLFLAHASFKVFVVYQMDVKSTFLYGMIEEEVYVCQPPWFEDPEFLDKVYKVEKALYGLHQAPRACQDKYVDQILKKFGFSTVKTASTPMETSKPLHKDVEAEDVDVYLYRSMIRSLMYLTASRPDIMFDVCAYARFQVKPKISHLYAVKRIFRYLKGQPKLGLWYPKDSPFDLEAYTDSDYADASLDRKSTTGGCQFLGRRLISWQCKKQTIVANSTTEAEYVASSSRRGQMRTVISSREDRMERAATTSLEAKQDSVAFLEKPKESDGFKGIIDFLNASSIRYALMVIPTIYTTCIEQFWSTAKVETVNGKANTKLVYKKRVFLDNQVEGMIKHKGIYVTPSHTKKVFANMKIPGKDFSGKVTPLFQTMMVQAPKDMGKDSAAPTNSYSTPIITQPSSSKPQKKQSRRKQRKDSGPTEPIPDEATNEEHIYTPSYDPPQSGKDRLQLTELMSLCTSLQEKVLDLEKAKTAQAKEIASLKKRVKQLEKRKKLRTSGLKRLRKVGLGSRVESSNDVSLGAQENPSKQGRKIADLDADAEVTLIDETQERNDEEISKQLNPKLLQLLADNRPLITRPKARGVVVQEPCEFKKTSSPSQASQLPYAKDKGKVIMVKPQKPLKRKNQIALDKEVARNLEAQLQTELEEEERLAR